jgi:hypothetical protein
MKLFILAFFVFTGFLTFSQTKDLHLKNALIIGQLDKSDDRYSVEIALTEILSNAGIKAIPSLNILKVGSEIKQLANDSIQKIVASKGIDTYMTVSVRGFDKKFKLAQVHDNLETALNTGHLFPLYRDEIVSISFEFTFYREGQFMATDIVKCGNVSSRETVMKRFRKKTAKRLTKWL